MHPRPRAASALTGITGVILFLQQQPARLIGLVLVFLAALPAVCGLAGRTLTTSRLKTLLCAGLLIYAAFHALPRAHHHRHTHRDRGTARRQRSGRVQHDDPH